MVCEGHKIPRHENDEESRQLDELYYFYSADIGRVPEGVMEEQWLAIVELRLESGETRGSLSANVLDCRKSHKCVSALVILTAFV